MWKKIIALLFVGGAGYLAYDYYKAGYHTRPDMPEGAFSLSYTNGFRAIMVDLPNEKGTRRYFGHTLDVPFYLENAWSFCVAPTNVENAEILTAISNSPGVRVEAVCRIDVDGDIVVRGFITTAPKL